MKTLILAGSPRPDGDSMALVGALRETLAGEVDLLRCYTSGIGPCVDCRYCWTHPGCAIDDPMQALHMAIDTYDNIVVASPIYTSSLTPPLLGVVSRLQVYYAASHFRGERLVHRPKRGALLLCGGGDGSAEPAIATAEYIFRHFRARCVASVISHNTNTVPARDDKAALAAARAAGEALSRA